eukprot:1649372-Rhodomonas_salina.1
MNASNLNFHSVPDAAVEYINEFFQLAAEAGRWFSVMICDNELEEAFRWQHRIHTHGSVTCNCRCKPDGLRRSWLLWGE